jgi:hypothetical protein
LPYSSRHVCWKISRPPFEAEEKNELSVVVAAVARAGLVAAAVISAVLAAAAAVRAASMRELQVAQSPVAVVAATAAPCTDGRLPTLQAGLLSGQADQSSRALGLFLSWLE